MLTPIIYRLTTNDIKTVKKMLNYYKDIGINALSIDLFQFIDEDRIREVLSLNDMLEKEAMRLIIKLNLVELGNTLLFERLKSSNRSNPKIRNASYQFINYLIRHGMKGFDFGNIKELVENKNDYKTLFSYVRELNKNTFYGKDDILTMAYIDTSNIDIISSLGSLNLNAFSLILSTHKNPLRDLYHDKNYLTDLDKNLVKKDSNIGISLRNDFNKYLNYMNYPHYSMSELIISSFFLRAVPVIDEKDIKRLKQNQRLFDFFKDIIKIIKKHKALNVGSFQNILKKDRDVFAYIRSYDKEKILCLYNFSEREMLINLSYYYIKDLDEYQYLIGNYGKRKIVKNICLRPYEAVSFIKL